MPEPVAACRSRHRLQDWALLVTATALFASGFTLIDITVTTVTPLSITAGRLVLAASVLYTWARALGHPLPRWQSETGGLSVQWRFFAILGLVGDVLPVTLITWGQQAVPSGRSAILVGLMPLMTLALAAVFVPSERIERRHLAGFVLGFLGLVVLIGPEALGLAVRHSLLHEVAILGGAVCFAVNAVLLKQMPAVPPLTASVGISLCAAGIAVPLALLCDAPWTLKPSALSLVGLGLLGLFPSALATLIYVRLVRAAGPTFAALTSYLVPPLAVFLSVVFLGQRLDWNAYGALILILTGVVASERRWRCSRHLGMQPQK
jgi:drug/metabolite transporter (DMT)-like permease